MAEYSQEEWQQMIARYSGELMTAYGNRYTPMMPSADSEANEETIQETPITNGTTESVIPAPPAERPDYETPSELTDIGRLQVRVSTENEAVPIPGAVVTVTNSDGALMQLMVTDENGLTEIIELPTKDRALSLSPGNPSPYTVYTIDVTAQGYFQKRFTDLPVYGGVTAIQNVAMIPLPEAGDNDIVLTYPQNGGPSML